MVVIFVMFVCFFWYLIPGLLLHYSAKDVEQAVEHHKLQTTQERRAVPD